MQKVALLFICLSVLLVSCTVIPKRFTQNPQISQNGGYVVEAENEKGFQLEIFYRSYSFIPNPDDNIQDAKNFFIRVAQDLAQQRGKNIKPILTSSLLTNSTRNIMDGKYAVYVSGRVEYIP